MATGRCWKDGIIALSIISSHLSSSKLYSVKSLTSPPILGHPDLKHPFVVYTDSSDTGLGAVLTQWKGTIQEEVITYVSRALNKAEIHYSTTEKECLNVVWALERWQHYLEPKLFTIVTDQKGVHKMECDCLSSSNKHDWVSDSIPKANYFNIRRWQS